MSSYRVSWGEIAKESRGLISPGPVRIGCVFRSRKGTFCRVLHTQVLEVIELTVSRLGLRIRRSSVSKVPD